MTVPLIALIVWVSFGPVLSLVMGRRGHSPAAWGTIGLLLGPLAVPLALDARWRRRVAGMVVLNRAEQPSGPVSVLAAIDGSPEAATAISRAVALLGDRIGRLSFVTVVDYDAVEDPQRLEQERALARAWMAAARAAADDREVDEYVIPGRPAAALARLAAEGGYDLIVVGPRGRGMSPRLFGSVATTLAATAPVPVLIGGQAHAAAPSTWTETNEAATPAATRH